MSLEPVAVALLVHDLGVMNGAVDHDGGDHRATEYLAPALEGLV